MNDLRELIGQTVTATVSEDEKGNDIDIRCKITSVDIEDFYFEEKHEPVYIRVNVEPLNDLPKHVDYEDLIGITLNNIRK